MKDWFIEWLDENDDLYEGGLTTEAFLMVALFSLIVLLLGLTALVLAVLVVAFASLVFIKTPLATWAMAVTVTAYFLWRHKRRHR